MNSPRVVLVVSEDMDRLVSSASESPSGKPRHSVSTDEEMEHDGLPWRYGGQMGSKPIFLQVKWKVWRSKSQPRQQRDWALFLSIAWVCMGWPDWSTPVPRRHSLREKGLRCQKWHAMLHQILTPRHSWSRLRRILHLLGFGLMAQALSFGSG